MKKLTDQFLKRDILIYSGIVLGVYYFVFNFAVNIFVGTNMFFNLILILGFLVGLVGALIVATAGIYYYITRVKDLTILIEGITSAIVVLFSLFGFQFIMALFSLMSGNYLSILANYATIISGLGVYSWAFYFAYLVAAFSLVLCLEMKNVLNITKLREFYSHAPSIVAPTQQSITDEISTAEVTNDQVSYNQQNVEPTGIVPAKPKNKKALIIGLAVAGVIVICGIGYVVYDQFFSGISINLVKNVELKYSGENGDAYATVLATTDYEGNNADIKDFLDQVYYTVDGDSVTNGELSNGQKVRVIANYSKSKANKHKINVTNDTFELEINGLVERYTDGTKISNELLTKMKTDADERAQSGLYNGSTTKEKIEFDSIYFAKTNIYSSKLIVVYKKTITSIPLFGGEETTTDKYVAYYLSNPKSDYTSTEYWSSRSLYNAEYKPVSTKEEAKAALVSEFSVLKDSLQELKLADSQ